MHKNHRRKQRPRHRGGKLIYSMAWSKRQKMHEWRARIRHLMSHERYDDITTKAYRNIIWEAF